MRQKLLQQVRSLSLWQCHTGLKSFLRPIFPSSIWVARHLDCGWPRKSWPAVRIQTTRGVRSEGQVSSRWDRGITAALRARTAWERAPSRGPSSLLTRPVYWEWGPQSPAFRRGFHQFRWECRMEQETLGSWGPCRPITEGPPSSWHPASQLGNLVPASLTTKNQLAVKSTKTIKCKRVSFLSQ